MDVSDASHGFNTDLRIKRLAPDDTPRIYLIGIGAIGANDVLYGAGLTQPVDAASPTLPVTAITVNPASRAASRLLQVRCVTWPVISSNVPSKSTAINMVSELCLKINVCRYCRIIN